MARPEHDSHPRTDSRRQRAGHRPRTLRAAPGVLWFVSALVLAGGSMLLGRTIDALPVLSGAWAAQIAAVTLAAGVSLLVMASRRQWARERAEGTLHALMNSSTDVLTVNDASGVLTYVSPAVERSLGRPAAALVGRPLHELADPEYRESVAHLLAQVVAAGHTARLGLDVLVVAASGERRWHEWTAHNLLADPLVRGVVVSQRDVTERLQHQARLAHAASHDPLTGLPNRGGLFGLMDSALAEAAPGAGVAVLFIDLDGFKQVNDQLGHATGDELLKVVAQRLRGCLRSQDHLGRFGGDEFCVVLTEVRDESEIRAIVDRVNNAVARPAALSRGTVTVRASVGVALTHDPTRTAASLCGTADQDMYRVKRERYAAHEEQGLIAG